jgi:hypothetical protein
MMHPGWQYPDAWMIKPIAEENAKAASAKQKFAGAPSQSILTNLSPAPSRVRPLLEDA